jgi:transcription termination/antitermination protein NusG
MLNVSAARKVLVEMEAKLQAQPWFALRVRSNYERITGVHLHERGYEQFAPSYKVERRWSDRTKQIDKFLFPGYIFCRFDPNDRLPILTVPGVVDVVGFGKSPQHIPDEEIERVRKLVESGVAVTPYPYMQVGQAVLIERGPLCGVEGILVEVKGKTRLVVSVNLLQRSVSAEIDRNTVRPITGLSTDRGRRTQQELG